MSVSPLTAELSGGTFDGVATLHPPTRSCVKVAEKIADVSLLYKPIPTKNDLRQVLEKVSTALADPRKESYGRKGMCRFSFSSIVFDPKECAWNGEVDYVVDEKSASDTGKEIISGITGSYMVNIQCFKVIPPNDDNVYHPFIVVDITLPLGESRHEINAGVMNAQQKTFDILKYNVARELYKLYLPDEFPEGCKGKAFRKVYQLNSKIKSGSFATVCVGTHRATKEKVAVKCTLRKKIQAYDDAVVYSEVGVLSTLKHKYICPINDFFIQDDCYFMVMEHMDGGDLFDRLGHKSTYNEEDARDLCGKLLEAVAFLHDNNIAHCDLKHNNLLLKTKEDDTFLKLADFGFAARVYAPNSLSDQCGTPYFVAPEIILRKPFGEKSDMWSVGVIIYCLLAGRVPFNGRRNVDLFRAVVNCEYEFDEGWDDISENAKDLIKSLLVTDPSERMSAREALQSQWIHDASGPKLSETNLSNASKQLSVFNARQKLKSIILTTQCMVAIQSMGRARTKKRNLLIAPQDIPDEVLDVDYASDAD